MEYYFGYKSGRLAYTWGEELAKHEMLDRGESMWDLLTCVTGHKFFLPFSLKLLLVLSFFHCYPSVSP